MSVRNEIAVQTAAEAEGAAIFRASNACRPTKRRRSGPVGRKIIIFVMRVTALHRVFHVLWPSTGRDGPSTEGHREMGMDQTVDHSRDGRIVRPGPARRALPDVVAQAPQP